LIVIMEKVFKTLSRNDTGETNSHQSGISIPKNIVELGIFPDLGTDELNPRRTLDFFEEDGTFWTFQFIYYNDYYFGKPKNKCHNEYRLTRVIDLIRKHEVKSGDEIYFYIDISGIRKVGFVKKEFSEHLKIDLNNIEIKKNVITLNKNWKTIKY
jgi:hypothetical protein